GNVHALGPPWNAQIESEMRSRRRDDSNFHAAVPRIVGLLRDLQVRAIFQVPIERGIIVKMQINSIAARAVEIARQRSEGAFKVWWAASEERRVGKECRCGWWPCREEKNKE